MPRIVLLQVIPPHMHHAEALAQLQELRLLVATFGGTVAADFVQHRSHADPSTYIGAGKLAELQALVKSARIDIVIANDLVSAAVLFRIEKAIWEVNPRIMVWDRLDLILQIFAKHATTTVAKLQIELAQLEHLGPRIYGLGGTVLSRQGAGIGTRGKGETNIELERRQIKARAQKIKAQLEHHSLMQEARHQRRQLQGMHTIALVGYTSAGKTSLFNALTARRKETNKGLFTTLDSVVGKLKIAPHAPTLLISDTIGFIENLPPSLIEAFRSTLLESVEADILLHVIDAADPKLEQKIATVATILEQLQVTGKQILLFNKVDQITTARRRQLHAQYRTKAHYFVSATTGVGLPVLKSYIKRTFLSATMATYVT